MGICIILNVWISFYWNFNQGVWTVRDHDNALNCLHRCYC